MRREIELPEEGGILDTYLLMRLDDARARTDTEPHEVDEIRKNVTDKILENRPEFALFNMIAARCDRTAPNPGLVILGARIGGIMKALSKASLDELSEYVRMSSQPQSPEELQLLLPTI